MRSRNLPEHRMVVRHKRPPPNCSRCPRLAIYRAENRRDHSDWYNAPVSSFGSLDAQLLIVGLAPGLRGANRTGRPFTGDFAGDLLYETLGTFDFSRGHYGAAIDDGLSLINCRITNAVRCVPPKNRPTSDEIRKCQIFLRAEIEAMPYLRAFIALGRVAHEAILRVYDLSRAQHKFTHGQKHDLSSAPVLFDSYHCSRYNTNTGRLTTHMFSSVIQDVCTFLKTPPT